MDRIVIDKIHAFADSVARSARNSTPVSFSMEIAGFAWDKIQRDLNRNPYKNGAVFGNTSAFYDQHDALR